MRNLIELASAKKYCASRSAKILKRFISLYVDQKKIPQYTLLWNSLKDEIDTRCFSFSRLVSLSFLKYKTLFLYNEREKALYQIEWKGIVDFIDGLEPWEDIDFLVFDNSFSWFAAVTHEDLQTVCAGTILSQIR